MKKTKIIENNLISIIVPIYNSSKMLDSCIKSLINQSYSNLEIILINDGSTDGSHDICLHYSKIDSRIIYVEKQNSGVSDTRNYGLKIFKGDFLTFVDSDDYISCYFIEKMYNQLIIDNADISVCNYYIVNDQKKKIANFYRFKFFINKKKYFSKLINSDIIQGFMWNKLYKRNLIIDNMVFFENDVKFCEDYFFNIKLAENVNCFTYINKPLYFYVQHDSNSVKKTSEFQKLKDIQLIIDYLECINSIYSNNFKLLFVYIIKKNNLDLSSSGTTINNKFMSYDNLNLFFKTGNLKLKLKYFLVSYLKIDLNKIRIK